METGEFFSSKENKIAIFMVAAFVGLQPSLGLTADQKIPAKYVDQNIGTLYPDGNSGSSYANALSADGLIAAGSSQFDSSNRNHATVWSGSNWGTKIDLGTLNSDNSGNSFVTDISADGSVVVGLADMQGSSVLHSVVWSGENYANKTDLAAHPDSYPGTSAETISADGKVVGGWMSRGPGTEATIWSGNGWSEITILNGLDSSINNADKFDSVNALSVDGTVAAGYSENGLGLSRAVVWSGTRWSELIDLGTLTIDNSGSSRAYAISTDGLVVGGDATDNTGKNSAVVWSGNALATKTNLGALDYSAAGGTVLSSRVSSLSGTGQVAVGNIVLETNNSRPVLWSGDNWSVVTYLAESGNASSISQDATVIGGWSSDGGAPHAWIWKITWPASAPEPDTPVLEAQPPLLPVPLPPVVKPVDVTMTGKSLYRLASDTFATLEVQRQALLRLGRGCLAYDSEFCWTIRQGFSRGITNDNHHNNQTGFSLGYGLRDYISFGVTLDKSWSQSLPDSYKHHNSNIGVGTFVELHQTTGGEQATGKTSEVYFRPSLFWNQNNVDIHRQVYSYTEAGHGKTTIRSVGGSLEAGVRYWRPDGINTSWYVGTRYTKVSRPGYTEREKAGQVDFPVSYDEVKYSRAVVYAGASLSVPVTERIRWVSSAEVSQKVSGHNPTFRTGAKYLGGVEREGDMRNTEGTASSGLEYTLDTQRGIRMAVMPGFTQPAMGETDWGGVLSIQGKF